MLTLPSSDVMPRSEIVCFVAGSSIVARSALMSATCRSKLIFLSSCETSVVSFEDAIDATLLPSTLIAIGPVVASS
ncbi:hypothetical protein D3C74_478850 [compost metagenome]